MGRRAELTGQKFGKLTVIESVGLNKHDKVCWSCKCECGKLTTVPTSHLRNGHTTSCGCLSPIKPTHGGYANKERLCLIWGAMRRRCCKKSYAGFKDYGGRGITVCDDWLNDYSLFKDWALANGYDDSLSIDRIDVNGNYEPSNCRWASRKVQNNNRRSNRLITFQGETKTAAEWAIVAGVNCHTFMSRIDKLNWPIDRVMTEQTRAW